MVDPLETVARLRRLALDEAKEALATCLRAEAEAAGALAALHAAIAAETSAAIAGADDRAVDAFGVWLRRTTDERAVAEAALARAEARTAEARAVLAASRGNKQAVQDLLLRRATDQAARESRGEQAVLDEANVTKWMTER